MTLSEKALYHQIHPLKLGADVGAAGLSAWLFWQHSLWMGLAAHFAPALLASAVVIGFANLEPQKRSAFGSYVRRAMTRRVEAVRLLGDGVLAFAAWFHSPSAIVAGVAIVIAAWLNGLVFAPSW